MMKNLKKNVKKLFLMAQKKCTDALNATQKKPSSLQSMVSEKRKKNTSKIPILTKMTQNGNFFKIFLDFVRNHTL